MRVKELWSLVPVPRRVVKHLHTSLTLSPYTIGFTLGLIIYTLVLSVLHLSSYQTTKSADVTLQTLIKAASIRTDLIPVVVSDQGQDVLQLCNGIPSSNNDGQCSTVFVPSSTPTESPVPANRPLSSSESTATPEAANAPTTSSSRSTTVVQTTSSVVPSSTQSSTTDTGAVLGIADILLATTTSTDDVQTTSTDDPALKSTSTEATESATATEVSSESTTSTTPPAITSAPPLITTGPSTTSTEASSTVVNAPDTTTTSTTSVESTTSFESITSVDSSTSIDSTTSTDSTSTDSTSTRSSTSTTSTSDPGVSIAETTSIDSLTGTDSVNGTAPSPSDVSLSPIVITVPVTTAHAATTSPTETYSVSFVVITTSITTSRIRSSSTTASSLAPTDPPSNITAALGNLGVTINSTSSEPSTTTNRTSEDSPSLQPTPDLPTRKRAMLHSRNLAASPVTNSSTGEIVGLNVTGLNGNEESYLSLVCAGALTLSEEQLKESWTEDLVMVGYHIWVLGVGFMAIGSESIPHLIAGFLSMVLALIWSGSQLAESRSFHSQFETFITNGACNGIELLPSYWGRRMSMDIAVFSLDAVAICAFGILASKLVSVYRHRMDVVVGDGQERRVYKTILLLSVIIQLGAFMQLVSLSLWTQQLFTSPIAAFSSSTGTFKVLSLISIVFTVPWFVVGIFAIRRENKLLMTVFCSINILFVGEWVVFFSSDVYRLVFTKWTFFAAGTVGAFGLLVGSLIAGIMAWMHFGRGLVDKLAESSKDAIDATPWEFSSDTEKAWEPFGNERTLARGLAPGGFLGDERPPSQFTAITGSSGRHSAAFSYGLQSPAPPMPGRRPDYVSRFSN